MKLVNLDKNRCIITKDSEHDVAHIYPISLRGHHIHAGSKETPNIWMTLKYFWTEDRVNRWYGTIFPQDEFVDVCHKMICLYPNAHRYHGKGYFALKPVAISEGRKCLTVKFYWLLKGPNSSSVRLCGHPSLEDRNQGPGLARLLNHEMSIGHETTVSDLIIRSGDEIQLTTEDPKKLPFASLGASRDAVDLESSCGNEWCC